jgi:hypothetical protein
MSTDVKKLINYFEKPKNNNIDIEDNISYLSNNDLEDSYRSTNNYFRMSQESSIDNSNCYDMFDIVTPIDDSNILSEFNSPNSELNILTNIQKLDEISQCRYDNYYDEDMISNDEDILYNNDIISMPNNNYIDDHIYLNSIHDSRVDLKISEISFKLNQSNHNILRSLEYYHKYINYFNIRYIILNFLLKYLHILFINIISTQILINNNYLISYINWVVISLSYGLTICVILNIHNYDIQYVQLNSIMTIIIYIFNYNDMIELNINYILFNICYESISSFLANLTIYGIYYNQINQITNVNTLGKIFSTQKNINVSIVSSSILLILLTVIYSICYFHILYKYHDKFIKSLILSICYILIFILFGYDIGYCLYPIHTMISNIFIIIIFKQYNIFIYNNYWSICAILIPFFGFLIGGLIYKKCIIKSKEIEI